MSNKKGLVIFPLLFFVSLSVHAAKLVPHFTNGPGIIYGGIPTIAMSGPKPILAGSDLGTGVDTGTDCSAISESDKLSTQTGGICQALEYWERLIKDDITINMEIYSIGLLEGILGFSVSRTVEISSPNGDGAGYDALVHLLKLSENAETDYLKAPRHLPSFAKLDVRINEFVSAPTDWKPQTVEITSAQAKALGLDLGDLSLVFTPEWVGLTTLPNVDSIFVTSQLIANIDVNQEDGIGASPVTIGEWDGLDVQNGIVPFPVFPEVFDFVGVATHEAGHSLGYFSAADSIIYGADLFNATDLFIFSGSDIKGMKNWAAYQKATRHAAVREDRPVPAGNVVPVEPELGDRFLVFDLHPKAGPRYIPMAGGGSGTPGQGLPAIGDNTQASHSRSKFVRSRSNSGDLQWLTWLESRCAEGDSSCDPITGDPGHVPSSRLMDPISVPHTVTKPSLADAIVLDLIGYDIDYSQLPDGPASGVFGEEKPGDIEPQISSETLINDFGVKLTFGARTNVER